MTDIPGANTVPDSSAVFRLAEDQMQQLMDNILAAGALLSSIDPKHTWSVVKFLKEDKPKPEPASVCVPHSLSQPHKPSVYGPGDHGYFGEPKSGPKQTECPTYDPEVYRKILEAQIKCLQSNLDAANDRAQIAQREVDRLKAQVPKERYSVWIEMNPKTMRWNAFPCAREGVMFDSTATKEETLQKCRDYGFEVVE